MAAVTLDPLDFAALVTSRVCHDVIGPVGAMVNGLEVMEEDKDGAMQEFALDLIRKSARQASARLQFARLAFGAAGSAGAAIDLGDAEAVAQGLFVDEKVTLTWSAPRALLPKNRVKLLLNLVVLAAAAVPRGGNVNVEVSGEDDQSVFVVTATGTQARIPNHAEQLLAGEAEDGVVTAHGIQPYYTGEVARGAGMKVTMAIEGETVTIRGENG